jgi:hypothetical protein
MAAYTVAAHRARLEAVFERAAAVTDLHTQADLARYLCVQVAGYLEQATRHIYGDYASAAAAPSVSRYVERRLSYFTNANAQRLCELAGDFDSGWRQNLEGFLEGERKDAIDSVIANRHQIAHGSDVGLTYRRISTYFAHVADTVEFLEHQCS